MISFVNRSQERMPRKFLAEWGERVARELRRRRVRVLKYVNVVLVDAPEMRRVNRSYRGKGYATDVLSFAMSPEEGEIVICPSVVKRNAKRGDMALAVDGKWGYKEELALMLLHSMLHLSGRDHSPEARAGEPMLRLQKEIFQKLWR